MASRQGVRTRPAPEPKSLNQFEPFIEGAERPSEHLASPNVEHW